jgi:hypothetical protein
MGFRVIAAGLAVLAGAATCLPASAAGAPRPQIVDATGDANGINNQGYQGIVPDVSAQTPTDVASADIVSVQFATTYAQRGGQRVITGSTVTMTMSAAPQPYILYRVAVLTQSCAQYVDLMYADPSTPMATNEVVCQRPPNQPIAYHVPPATAHGRTVVWTLPAAAFPAGSKFHQLIAQTGTDTAATFLPYYDQAASDRAFVVGG